MSSILIIEDDDLFRDALANALADRGYSVTQAADGAEGVKEFRAAPTDLVLTDIVMPNQEGLETIAALRRDQPTLGIIAMSGGLAHDAPLYLKVAGGLGANRTLKKPFALPILLAAIEDVLAAAGKKPPPAPAADLPRPIAVDPPVPKIQPAPVTMPSLHVASHLGASLTTILIIDDDVPLASTLALGLEANGYRALCAADATIGWKMAHAHLPDLILSDIEMPGKDGRRLLQEMRADPAIADRQFVLMTGKASFGNQRTAMDLGADDFLLKPFTLPALLGCVAARLRRAELNRRVDDRAVEQMQQSLGSNLPQKFFMPLASVLGLAQLLEAEIDTQSKDEMRQDLRDIQLAARRLHRTLRNHLLMLDLEPAGRDQPVPLLDAATVRKDLASGIAAAAEPHRRTADLALDLTGASIRAYHTDLGIVAEELVDNAFVFSCPGTPVRVRAWAEGAAFHFTVADSGRGLTPEQLEQIRALHGGAGHLREQEGLGMGLTLVRKIVTRLGGEFDLESVAGQGTTCRISLPIGTP
jgi:two-component system sensor histidine kinase/response regulator